MALHARFKPAMWDSEDGNSAAPGHAPDAWRVLCGYQNCRGRLAFLSFGLRSNDSVDLDLAAGYVQSAPNVWRLGRHAARQPDHMPRRPRLTVRSSSEHARRRRDGEVILPDGRLLSQEIALRRDIPARVMPRPNVQVEHVALGTMLTIECSRCHASSQFVVRPSAAILEEVKRRAHGAA